MPMPPPLGPEQLTNPAIRIKVAEAVGGVERRVEDAERQLEKAEAKLRQGDRINIAIALSIVTMLGSFGAWVNKQAEKQGERGVVAVEAFERKSDARATGLEVQVNELRRDTNERDRRLEQKIDALDAMMRTLDRDLRRGKVAK